MFRLNVDQVPLPFVNDMDYTYDMKGAKRVSINQLGPSLSKRQCTAQVCFRPVAPPPPPSTADDAAKARYKEHSLAQPLPCLVFRGTGKQISQLEQDAYPDELVVLCLATQGVGGPAYRSGLARKYFEHAGGLLTADGSDDTLIKLEGAPDKEKFEWEDDISDDDSPLPNYPPDPEPIDPDELLHVGEVEEMEIGSGGGGGMEEFDDSDDDDDDDNDDGAQPAECIPPSGFSIVKDIPPAETLTLGSPLHKALVGQHLLYRWPLVG
eukprot:scaffold88091_cov30-Tisochrysis_lutea.AAC.1